MLSTCLKSIVVVFTLIYSFPLRIRNTEYLRVLVKQEFHNDRREDDGSTVEIVFWQVVEEQGKCVEN